MKREALGLAVLFLAALPMPGHAGDDPAPIAERSEQVADARGLAGLDVDNSRGRVVLTPSADGRLHVVATRLARMADPADARHYLAQTTVESGVRAGRYRIEVHYPRHIETGFQFFDLFSERGRRHLHLPSLEVVLEVAVPAGLDVGVATVSGDVTAGSLAGAVRVSTTSGSVNLQALKRPVEIETVSGDVTLDEIAGARVRTTSGDVTAHATHALDCRTVSGDIGVDGSREALKISSESGDVDVNDAPAGIQAHSTSGAIAVRGAAGDVRIDTASGDIHAELRSPLRGADLSSTSGSLEADLAPGLGAQLAAATTSGSIDCRAGLTLLRHDPHSLEGRIGSGGPAIRVHTISGDLTVTSGGK